MFEIFNRIKRLEVMMNLLVKQNREFINYLEYLAETYNSNLDGQQENLSLIREMMDGIKGKVSQLDPDQTDWNQLLEDDVQP